MLQPVASNSLATCLPLHPTRHSAGVRQHADYLGYTSCRPRLRESRTIQSSIQSTAAAHPANCPTSQNGAASSQGGVTEEERSVTASLPGSLASTNLVEFVTAWEQLALRLPPHAGLARSGFILNALKLAVAHRPAQRLGQADPPASRALAVASRLADLSAQGLPMDAESIAAGILADAVQLGSLSVAVVEQRLGPIVAHLLHDLIRVRTLPARVDLYDDTAASALRELCLSFYDVRAIVVEVVARLDSLCAAPPDTPRYLRQLAALEALQIYAPMGHALGMGRLAVEMEDRCFQDLFPRSYQETSSWLRQEMTVHEDTLERCQAHLLAAVHANPDFMSMAAGCEVLARTKSLFSTMKKLLRLGAMAKGGRKREEVYDLLGMRVIVKPRTDLPMEQAEAEAEKACYIVEKVAHSLWQQHEGRYKDYIREPKENGYQSLHTTVRVPSVTVEVHPNAADGYTLDNGLGSGSGSADGAVSVELQIRTQSMHELAESGEAAHAAYKGGLDAGQARRLQTWTESLQQSLQQMAAAPGWQAEGGRTASRLWQDAEAAAEELFRHLDKNGDGFISHQEMQQVLAELGVQSDASNAAAQLMAFVNTQEDGDVSFPDFLQFHKRAGVLQALPHVDEETVDSLRRCQEDHPRVPQGPPGTADSASGSGQDDPDASSEDRLDMTRTASSSQAARGSGSAAPGGRMGRRVLALSVEPQASSRCHGGQNAQIGDDGGTESLTVDAAYGNDSQPINSAWASPVGQEQDNSLQQPDGDTSRTGQRGVQRSWVRRGNSTADSLVASREQNTQENSKSASAKDQSHDDVSGSNKNSRRIGRSSQRHSAAGSAAEPRAKSGRRASSQLGRVTLDLGDAPVDLDLPGVADSFDDLLLLSSLASTAGAGAAASGLSSDGEDWYAVDGQHARSALAQPAPRPTSGRPPEAASGARAAPTSSAQLTTPSQEAGGAEELREPGVTSDSASAGEAEEDGPEVEVVARRKPVRRKKDIAGAVAERLDSALPQVVRQRRKRAPGPGEVRVDTWDLVPSESGMVLRMPNGRPYPTNRIPVPLMGPLVIGGSAARDCDVVVDDASVSGRHVRLEMVRLDWRGHKIRCLVTDLDSTNGTWLNRGRLRKYADAHARAGDLVSLTAAGVRFRLEPTSEPDRHSALQAALQLLPEPPAPPNGSSNTSSLLPAAHQRSAGDVAQDRVVPDALPNAGPALARLQQQVRDNAGDGRLWLQLAQCQHHAARAHAQRSGYAIARAYFRAAMELLERASSGQEQPRVFFPTNFQLRDARAAQAYVGALRRWGRMEAELRHDTSARRLWRKAVDIAKQHPDGLEAAGGLHTLAAWAHKELDQRNLWKAARMCDEALRASPNNARLLKLRGRIEAAADRCDEARVWFSRSRAQNSGDVALLLSWARMEAETGHMERARQLFADALTLDPCNAVLMQAWAHAESGCGNFAAARSLFKRSLFEAGDAKQTWHAWAVMEARVGEEAVARSLFRRVLQLDPANTRALAALAALERGAGRLGEARRYAEQGLSWEPFNPGLVQELAWALEAEGQYAAAGRLLTKADSMRARLRLASGSKPANMFRRRLS